MLALYTGLSISKDTYYTHLCPECTLHPIKQLEWAYAQDYSRDFSVFTHSPYIYEALVRHAVTQNGLIKYYHNGVKCESIVEAFESFSEPFKTFDLEDENKLQGISNE